MLRLLAALGTGFDCASNNEISRVLDLGFVDPSRIIFANPCKALSFIRNAAKAGVDMMTFDNVDELHKIARTHPRAKLVVRILTDDSKSLCALGTKFGAPLATVPGLLATARRLNLFVIGVSFHVGSGCFDISAFADAVGRARTAFDMGREAGYEFTLLDVGGGFEDATFEASARVLSEAIEHHFPDRESIRIIAEPGRFYVSKAFYLAANIIARRAPLDEGKREAPKPSDEDSSAPRVMCTCLKNFVPPLFRILFFCPYYVFSISALCSHRDFQITSTTVFTDRSIVYCLIIRSCTLMCFLCAVLSMFLPRSRSVRAVCGDQPAIRSTASVH